MKYIVTSSLNIDNILSTESISPRSFYGKREFGYQSFEPLQQLDFEEQLVLFSAIPVFQIDDEERENYPLVLQIDDEEQLRNATEIANVDGCKIFAFYDTIRINPTNCKILFFSDKARVLSRHNCMDSQKNKLINYYKFETVNASGLRLEDMVAQIDKARITNQTVVFRDNITDRAKGFICGYYIGCNKELSPKTADILSKQKRIYDIVSAKINNKGTATELLDKELAELDKYLSDNDPVKQKCRELWCRFVSKYELPTDKFDAALQELGLERNAKTKFANDNGIFFCPDLKDSFSLESYRANLGSYVDRLVWTERKSGINVSDEIKIAESFDFELAGDDENIRLFNMMVKIVADLDIDDLRTNRFDIINFFGKAIGDYFKQNGRTFDGSPERNFIVSLVKNVRSATPFNLHDVDNIVLQSLAAFILKGEDYDSLVDYLAVNAVPTYKYALAFWGAALGYVGMSRPLLEKEIKMAEFFPQVWKLTTGREMIGKLEVQTYQPIVFKPELEEENIHEEAISEVHATNIDSFKSMIWKTFEGIKKGLRNQDKLKEDLEKALLANGNNTDRFLFVKLLKDYWEEKNKPWKTIQQELCPDYNERIGEDKGFLQKGIEAVKNLFSSTSSNEDKSILSQKQPVGHFFYCDKNAWNHIAPYLPNDNNLRKQFFIDLNWFQENHKESYNDSKKGMQKGFYFGKPIDNEATINRYHSYMLNKRDNNNPKTKWLADYYSKVDIERIVLKLKELYNVK